MLRFSLTLLAASLTATGADEPDGAQIYRRHCARCHDAGVGRAPQFDVLQQLPAQAIERSLESGSMRFVFEGLGPLSSPSRGAVARFITSGADQPSPVEVSGGKCVDGPAFSSPLEGPRWVGWGVDISNTRSQSMEMAGLSAQDLPKVKLKWAFGFPGANMAWGHPTVAGGRIYVGSPRGTVFSLDAKSGCTHWAFEARGPVRTVVQIAPGRGERAGRFNAYFADMRASVYAVDAETGEEVWRKKGEEHAAAMITSSPQLYEGRLYVGVSSFEEVSGGRPEYECCRFRGSVIALAADNGEQIWKTYTIAEEPSKRARNSKGVQLWGPSGAGVWTAPTIDRKLNRLYVTTGDNYSDPPSETSDAILAFDLDTGERIWSRQFTRGDAFNVACVPGVDNTNCPESRGPDFDFGSSAILSSLPSGKRLLAAGQKSGWMHVVDPDKDGEVVWQSQVGQGGLIGGIQWGPALDGGRLYVAISDLAFYIKTDPNGRPRGAPNPLAGGGLRAYEIADGKQVWYAPPIHCDDTPRCSPGQSAAVTVIPGAVLSGSLDGRLRAYSTKDGSVLWDFNTIRDYETVNGVKARGGAINGPGAVVVGGMLYVNSGYGQFGTIPGNVLLAFALED